MAGVRTNSRGYASCCLIGIDDTKESLTGSATAISLATASRCCIGFDVSKIRAIGSPVNGGSIVHTGIIPFLKIYESCVKAWCQNSTRGGSATANIQWWHYEIEDIVVLKNNAGTDDNRVRKLDYTVGMSKLFYDRVIKNESVTLFSPHEVPHLYQAWGSSKFDKIYEECESDRKIKMKKKISARKLMSLIVKERVETGRIYILNVDTANEHSPWEDQVTMSNLCTEIIFPTIPIQDYNDPEGEIGMCILSAVNMLEIKNWSDLEKTCELIVRFLDEIIDVQDYFNKAAENFAKKRRSLGVGITNLAAFLAKNELKYTASKALPVLDQWMEHFQYYLLKASLQLAKEKGKCEKFDPTKYAQGILPIDTYKKKVNELVRRKFESDWEHLRKEIKEHGLRHSTCSAIMPCESCQSLETKIQTSQGIFTLGELIVQAGLDIKAIEEQGIPSWYELPRPFYVKTLQGDQIVERIYYNGLSSDVYEVEFEDGKSYKFTGNHKLLVKRESFDVWVYVKDLKENDEIIEISSHNIKIKKITKLTEKVQTYDIEVASVHHYALDNGCIAHNSSVIQNSTNGVEPVRSLITYKMSKMGKLPVLVPGIGKYEQNYELAFDLPDNTGIIHINAILQKYIDMAISTNIYYNYSHYPNHVLPDSKVMKEIMYAYSNGLISLYYNNTDDGDKEQSLKEENNDCSSGACKL